MSLDIATFETYIYNEKVLVNEIEEAVCNAVRNFTVCSGKSLTDEVSFLLNFNQLYENIITIRIYQYIAHVVSHYELQITPGGARLPPST